jgi:predicted transcriptional regulator
VSERKNNRGKIEIMADILGLSTVGIKKTHIMYRANLSYEQISYYLSELQSHGLLEQVVEDDLPVYRTTEKGRAFLHHFSRMAELINGYSAQEPEKVSLLA